MYLFTVTDLPGQHWTAIGLVSASHDSLLGHVALDDALAAMAQKASKMGAHAVLGIQIATVRGRGNNVVTTTVIGTAVKFPPAALGGSGPSGQSS